jgi:hypothetical protein
MTRKSASLTRLQVEKGRPCSTGIERAGRDQFRPASAGTWWLRTEAAYAHYRITGNPATAALLDGEV